MNTVDSHCNEVASKEFLFKKKSQLIFTPVGSKCFVTLTSYKKSAAFEKQISLSLGACCCMEIHRIILRRCLIASFGKNILT